MIEGKAAASILALDGDDLRQLPLSMRKRDLARLLGTRSDGIFRRAVRAGRDRPRPVPQGLRGLEGVWCPSTRSAPIALAATTIGSGLIDREAAGSYVLTDARR